MCFAGLIAGIFLFYTRLNPISIPQKRKYQIGKKKFNSNKCWERLKLSFLSAMCLCQSVTQILSDVFLNVICLILLFSFLHIKCRAEKGNLGVPLLPGQGCSFYSFKTNTYKLNFMGSPSGIKVSVAYFLSLLPS